MLCRQLSGASGFRTMQRRTWTCRHLTCSLDRRLAETRLWLDQVVIGEKLCPFAQPISQPPKLRMRASTADTEDGVVRELAEEAQLLHAGLESPILESPETVLLVLGSRIGGIMLTWQGLTTLSWRLQAEAIVVRYRL